MIESTPTRTWVVIGFVVVGTFFLTVGNDRSVETAERVQPDARHEQAGDYRNGRDLSRRVRVLRSGGAGLSSLIGIVFLFLTVPTGAHMISRAAEQIGVPFLGSVTWPGKSDDE